MPGRIRVEIVVVIAGEGKWSTCSGCKLYFETNDETLGAIPSLGTMFSSQSLGSALGPGGVSL